MMRIGLFGESSYDTDAVFNLLSKQYTGRFKFVKLSAIKDATILERKGKMQKLLEIEIEAHEDISAIIFVRDLDGNEHNKTARQKREEWFEELSKPLPLKTLLLLNVYELEALILADIESFNRLFRISIKYPGDPMAKEKPKEFLIQKTRCHRRTFTVSDNPEVFNHLDFEQVKKKCRYFRDFTVALERLDQQA